jgi:hypothetical protein
MKIPLTTHCDSCGEVEIFVDLGRSASDPVCPHGHDLPTLLTGSVPVGHMIYMKADYEYRRNKDYSMTIVLAAAALESEISRLHHKWERIRGIDNGDWMDGDTLDKKLRRYRSIVEKIEGVAELMHPAGLQDFLSTAPEVRTTITDGFPSLKLSTFAQDLQRLLFWPRNQILHAGYGQHSESDARHCLSYAALGRFVFEALDREASGSAP